MKRLNLPAIAGTVAFLVAFSYVLLTWPSWWPS